MCPTEITTSCGKICAVRTGSAGIANARRSPAATGGAAMTGLMAGRDPGIMISPTPEFAARPAGRAAPLGES